jgi:hypothetical protein
MNYTSKGKSRSGPDSTEGNEVNEEFFTRIRAIFDPALVGTLSEFSAKNLK